MSKGPWKSETKLKHSKRSPVKPIPIEPEMGPRGTVPPPLPPISGGVADDAPGAAPSNSGPTVFDESKIKGGLGKAFCSVTQGMATFVNHLLRNSHYEIEFTPIEPEMGDLWAEFAFPVLKLHMPNLENNPHLVLVMMTGLILSGKIRVKTKEVTPNAGNSSEKTSEAVA